MSNEHRLPDTVLPTVYELSLDPDLDALTYKGEVTIHVDVKAATGAITLNCVDLNIAEALIDGEAAMVSVDKDKERIKLTAKRTVDKGKTKVTIRFSGVISDKMRGFYRSRYTAADGTTRMMGTTQFEATSARRAFPCFDEPGLKAAFDVTILTPPGRTAVSNMPVSSVETEGARRRVKFARTPVMSTYLLAFAVGEFDLIEGRTKDGMAVRVYTTPGRSKLGRFALDTAIKGLEFFDDYYGIPYRNALPKCDLLAIPDFEAGAMENWGAITFRETAIFIDPERSSVPQLRRVAEVVLHELAHQWFGNLVSPEWWSYLWLNESFATFMAFKAADAIFPEWRIWEDYLAQTTQGGISLDSLRSSHPVEVPVKNPNEVDQIFDAISYNKGGSVLRMLEQSIGEIAFRDGIRKYLKKHAYACATSDDLWGALGKNIPKMMDGWTRQTGLPVLVAQGGKLRQERFFLDRDPAKPASDPTLWDVPVSVHGVKKPLQLSKREAPLPKKGAKLNAGQAGFYLVHYGDDWKTITKGARKLPSMDRFGLQADAYSLMRAGYMTVPAYLELVLSFEGEENHHVLAGLSGGLRGLAEIYVGDPAVQKLEQAAWKLFRPVVEKIGWAEKKGESQDRVLLRSTVLSAAVHFGDPDVVTEVRRRFESARKDLNSLAPNLQGLVFAGAARHGDGAVLDGLVSMYEKAELPETKVRLLGAMSAFRDGGVLKRTAAYGLSDKVRSQDAFYAFSAVPIEAKPASWALLKEHWETVDKRYGKSGFLGHFIAGASGGVPSEDHARDMEAWFKDHPAPYATEKIKQTLEGIRARAKFRERNAGALAQFFGGV